MKHLYKYVVISLLFIGCNHPKNKETKKQNISVEKGKTISESAKRVRDYIKKNLIIAHRGSTYWTPEETEPAFLWARNIGADYLELDVQLTKDNVLIAFHDDDLRRTTNVENIFPERTTAEINEFTLIELQRLDVGSSFNKNNLDRARESFKDLKIMTLKDVIMIAEGFRIKKENGKSVQKLIDGKWNGTYVYEKDPSDNGNRPGIYVETKSPKPTTEKILAQEISDYGWNININPKVIQTYNGKVEVANTNARFILQSFSRESLVKLEHYLPNIPKCLLLWQPDMIDGLKESYNDAINFCIANNVEIIGSSIVGEPNNYKDLTIPWMAALIQNADMLIHPYTFDTNQQFNNYKSVDGVFTNRADLALEFYNRKSSATPQEVLNTLGYK